VRTVLRTRGFGVVDLGKNVSVEAIVEACKEANPLAVGISGLLTLVVPQLKKVRQALRAAGLDDVLVVAGGAALKQGTPESLNVDYVAESVFDGVHYLERATSRSGSNGGPSISESKPTALENVFCTLRFERTARPPVFPQLFGHAARHVGLTLREYRQSGATVAECQLAARAAYGHDAVFAIMDLNVEAEAMGARLNDPADAYADIMEHPIARAADVGKLELPNPEKDGRMPEILRACKVLRKEVREDFPVVGGVLGPVTLASQLVGLENFLFGFHDDPEATEALLDFATSVVMAFGLAQLRAGAHLPLVLDPAASPAVLPHKLFRRYAAPGLQRIFHEFSQNDAIANWILITGDISPILTDLPSTGANLVNLDYCVSPAAARAALPRMALNGNIAPLAFVESTPDQIARDAQILVETFKPSGGWILSAGCEIPPEAHPPNIIAMVRAVCDH
jgi:uroporphyrinogen decarboxylase